MFDFDSLDDAEATGESSRDDSAAAEQQDLEDDALSGDVDRPATAKGAALLQAAGRLPLACEAAPADDRKKTYWKVVKTVDAGGIAVRSDGVSGAGRLQLHSVVLEQDRQGLDLHYEGVTGMSFGPRSGWVKIETKGTTWMECLGSDYNKETIIHNPTSKAQQLTAVILFDWDDTLCPTSWIEECPQLRNAVQGQVPRTGEVWERLAEQATAVQQLVETAASLATVALVTLAERPWVAVSIRDFLPSAQAVMGLEVYYAREGSLPRVPTSVDLLTAMKRRAMQAAVEAMVMKLGKGTTWESFISIGDSDVEKRAAQDFGRECQSKGVIKYTKTVKMMEHPSVKQLTTQCRALNEKLREFILFPGHKHVTSADLMRQR